MLSFTHGFSRVIVNVKEKRKPFKRFPVIALVQFTWLKPGVNEIELVERLVVQSSPSELLK